MRAAALLILGMLADGVAAAVNVDAVQATKVQAAYLYQLTKFVDWPSLPPGELRICVLGADAIGRLMPGLAGQPVRDRTIKVEVESIADPAACQVLFIGSGDRRLPDLLHRLRTAPVLTVSDAEDFTRRGGIVGFYLEGGRIKLEINPDAARAANLRISAKLLEVARTVPKP